MKTRTQKKKAGISLIVLVITIIVMIILAAAIILSLNSSGIIGKANKAKLDTDKANLLEAANVAYAEYQLEKQLGELTPANQTGEAYVKAKLGDQFDAETLKSLSILDDGTVQVLPVIPTGFVVSQIEGENKISEGLVIYKLKANETEISASDWAATDTTTVSGQTLLKVQTERDQYVWIPVEGAFERKSWTNDYLTEYGIEPIRDGIAHMDDIANYADEIAQYNAMKASVEKNGGFYIARYEAGQEGATAVSKKGATVWYNIAWDSSWDFDMETMEMISGITYGDDSEEGAAKYAKASYSNAERHLIYGVQWDTALKFIEDSAHSVTNSSTWGNYVDYNSSVDSSKQVTGAGGYDPLTAGYSEHWKAKNIYDLAGNANEWTYEAYDDDFGCRIFRDVGCAGYGAYEPVATRKIVPPKAGAGFRFALYIK